jgi:hypothetical protein
MSDENFDYEFEQIMKRVVAAEKEIKAAMPVSLLELSSSFIVS